MKIALTISSKIFDDAQVRAILSAVVRTAKLDLESDIKTNLQINAQKAAGKTYRRGRITKAASKITKAINLRHFVTAKGNERAIIGYKFHRASAKGQSPATDTGGLIGSVAGRDLAELRARVSVGKKYGAILDDPTKLNRPFFKVRVDLFRPNFKQRVLDALRSL